MTESEAKVYQKKYYLEHKEELDDRVKMWKQNNKEKLLEYNRNYYRLHNKKITESQKEWQKNNPDKVAKYRKAEKLKGKKPSSYNKERRAEYNASKITGDWEEYNKKYNSNLPKIKKP